MLNKPLNFKGIISESSVFQIGYINNPSKTKSLNVYFKPGAIKTASSLVLGISSPFKISSFESLNEVSNEHDEIMTHMLKQLPKLAKEQGLDDGFRTIINTGPGGGQVVFHLHMHLLGGSNLPGFQ